MSVKKKQGLGDTFTICCPAGIIASDSNTSQDGPCRPGDSFFTLVSLTEKEMGYRCVCKRGHTEGNTSYGLKYNL